MARDLYFREIDEFPGAGRLGRHVLHDSRSLEYTIAENFAAITSVLWKRDIPVLDQGNVGACTGYAATGALGTDPFFATVPKGTKLDNTEGLVLYSAAERIDGGEGYPPEDDGSTGLSVAKAAKNAGLISGYQHALSLNAALTALASGPVITGVNWYDSFDQPDSNGTVSISPDAQVRGGHEFEVIGVDVEAQTVHAVNSWGDSWGDHGEFSFSFDTWTRLLTEDGDVTQFVPLSKPAPIPTPPSPAPSKKIAWPSSDPAAHVSQAAYENVGFAFARDHQSLNPFKE
jgi:hypothetical protein